MKFPVGPVKSPFCPVPSAEVLRGAGDEASRKVDLFPVSPSRFPVACSLPVPSIVMAGKSVLIVGEDDLIAWAIRKRLAAAQVAVRIVRTPEEALAALREAPFDRVVFDPDLLDGKDPAVIGAFHGVSGAAMSASVPGGEPAETPETVVSCTEIRFVEKPLNRFDLDRFVEGMVGEFSGKESE